ncbi:MAG: hypothetical protein ABFC62_02205 [Clostridiaceae bacterium]|nr:hypothetical protein [Eubacteriales bacterium]
MKAFRQPAAKARVLSTPVLVSSFVVSAVVIGLCVWQAIALPKDRILYICLAAVGLFYGVFIGMANHRNKKSVKKR